MPGDWKQALEARLADVPKGELLVCAKSDTLFFSPPACACIGQDDKGRLDIWPLYPGVELTLQAYSAKFVAFHHDVPGAPLLEINHCYAGRVGCTSDTRPGAVSRRGRSFPARAAHLRGNGHAVPFRRLSGLQFPHRHRTAGRKSAGIHARRGRNRRADSHPASAEKTAFPCSPRRSRLARCSTRSTLCRSGC